MHVPKIYLSMLTAFVFILTSVAKAETPPASSIESNTFVIVVSGDIPGFTQAQLTDFLAKKTQDEIGAPWHFIAGRSGEELAPNRMVWLFKTLRVEWKGGSHKGFPSPTYSETYLSAEVKLYLKNDYQMTTLDTNPLVMGGPDDKSLFKMVHDVSHALFVENKSNTPLR